MLAINTNQNEPVAPPTRPQLIPPAERSTSELLTCITAVQPCRAKEPIFHEGDRGEHLFEVLEGVVKLYKLTPDGRCQVTGFLYPGQWLGLEWNGDYTQSAEAVTPAKLCRYNRTRIEDLAERSPQLTRRLLALTTNELVAAQDQMLLLGRKTAAEKLCSFLLRLSQDAQERGADPNEIDLPMNRADIADYLGLTTETVSRTIGRLKDLDVIAFRDQRHLIVRDMDRLTELAEDEELARVPC